MTMSRLNIILMLALFLASCSDEWNAHYKDPQGEMQKSDLNVWDYLQQNPDYSEFVGLIRETQADTLFSAEQRYTMWIPKNGSISASFYQLSDSVRALTVRNHISNLDYSSSAFREGLSMLSLSRKHLHMHIDPENPDGFILYHTKVGKTVMSCKNGVIHEMEGIIDLQPTIFDYFVDSEYSVLRELVFSFKDSVFDPENSIEMGMDFEGNTIYDSVFIIKYRVFNYGPIDKDGSFYHTAFLTDNDELTHEINQYYENIWAITGEEPRGEDSVKLKEWIVNSFIHRGMVEDYGKEKNLRSVRNTLWNTEYQLIDPLSRMEFSNGCIYKMKDLFIPNSFIQKELMNIVSNSYDANPECISVEITGGLTAADFDITTEQVKIAGLNTPYLSSKIKMKLPSEDFPEFTYRFSWETNMLDSTKVARPVSVCPGEYTVSLDFVKTADANQNFKLFINDDIYVGTVNMDNYKDFDKRYNVNLGRVNIPQSAGVSRVKVSLESVSKSWKRALAPFSVSLKPTVNNY